MDSQDGIRLMANNVILMRDAILKWYADDPKRKEEAEEWYRQAKERVKEGKQ